MNRPIPANDVLLDVCAICAWRQHPPTTLGISRGVPGRTSSTSDPPDTTHLVNTHACYRFHRISRTKQDSDDDRDRAHCPPCSTYPSQLLASILLHPYRVHRPATAKGTRSDNRTLCNSLPVLIPPRLTRGSEIWCGQTYCSPLALR